MSHILDCFGPLLNKFDFLGTLKKKNLENITETEENAGNQHFLFFPLTIKIDVNSC